MKLVLAVCVLLLSVVMVQAEDEMSSTTLQGGTRVINGKPAVPRQFPFMAYVKSQDGPGTRHCGGSLITRTAVLTSAWCVYEHKKYTVRLGSIYRTKEDSNAWTAVSILVLWHPDYNSTTKFSNVAIIYLHKRLPSTYIQLVDLPNSPNLGSFMGCHGTISGWGETSIGSGFSEVLRWTKVIVIPNEICAKFINDRYVSERSLCAGSITSAVYEGDDGGALVLQKPGGRYLQIGMHIMRDYASFNVSKPAIYTRLTYYLEWIRMKTMHV